MAALGGCGTGEGSVLAPKCQSLRELPVSLNSPKGLAILTGGSLDAYPFPVSTATVCERRVFLFYDGFVV
jgi:hypothetical protein